MRTITLSNGETVEVECLSCALTSGLVEPDGGVIGETAYFHAHQDVAYPIKGLVIVASKRHVISLDELTEVERQDYISFLAKIRKAQRAALGLGMSIISIMRTQPIIFIHGWYRATVGWNHSAARLSPFGLSCFTHESK